MHTGTTHDPPENTPSPPFDAAPPIEIDAFETYLVGFPMVVAVTCYNPTEHRTFGNLPEVDLLTAPGPVAFTFVAEETGRRIPLPVRSDARLEPGQGQGFWLLPGERRRMLFDLSALAPTLKPGAYRLEARYHRKIGFSEATPVPVQVVAPASEDRTIAELLRTYNDLSDPSWIHFLLYNWRTIHVSDRVRVGMRSFPRVLDASELSDKARGVLAFHLFLHRAIYGPQDIAELNVTKTDTFAQGPLEGEAAVLRYEILWTRRAPSAAALEAEIRATHPGLHWRLDEIKEGAGFMARLRRTRGAERPFETPPAFWPYNDSY